LKLERKKTTFSVLFIFSRIARQWAAAAAKFDEGGSSGRKKKANERGGEERGRRIQINHFFADK
jgi:hypothetical protein